MLSQLPVLNGYLKRTFGRYCPIAIPAERLSWTHGAAAAVAELSDQPTATSDQPTASSDQPIPAD